MLSKTFSIHSENPLKKTNMLMNLISKWMELLAGTVPANKLLFAGTVPANKFLLAGTYPVKLDSHCHTRPYLDSQP